jgi:hypothetical protein
MGTGSTERRPEVGGSPFRRPEMGPRPSGLPKQGAGSRVQQALSVDCGAIRAGRQPARPPTYVAELHHLAGG